VGVSIQAEYQRNSMFSNGKGRILRNACHGNAKFNSGWQINVVEASTAQCNQRYARFVQLFKGFPVDTVIDETAHCIVTLAQGCRLSVQVRFEEGKLMI
jgi:hypothetical protein